MADKIALITGAAGQDGSYLCELLLQKSYIIHAVVRAADAALPWRIQHLLDDSHVLGKRLFLHTADVRDNIEMSRILRLAQPNELYHLAGQSHVGRSFSSPDATQHDITTPTLQLLDIVSAELPAVRFFHASSAEIFGDTKQLPQTESTPMQPVTPYGRAKAEATEAARQFRDSRGLFVCNGILYNHESPRRGEDFVTRKIARAAARISRGMETDLALGNLESRRDWGRAQEYVYAMWLMLQHSVPDDYIVATGHTHSVRDFVQAAFDTVGLAWEKFVRYEPAFDRPSDPQLVGCAEKIRRQLGWKAAGTFEQLVREMVEAELKRSAT